MLEVELKNGKSVLLFINHISSIEDITVEEDVASLIFMNNGKSYVSLANYIDLKESLLQFYSGTTDEH